MSTALPPPGWYGDPGDESQWRYWNGEAWTEEVSPASGVSAGASPSTALPGVSRHRLLLLLPAGAALVGLGAVLGLALAGGDDDPDDLRDGQETAQPERDEEVAAVEPDAPNEPDEAGDVGEAGGSDPEPTVEQMTGDPRVSGAALPPFDDERADPAQGARVPAVVGTDFDGQPVSIGQGGDEVVVFLAFWSPSCQVILPELARWSTTGRVPDDVDLILVNTMSSEDTRPNWPPDAWYAEEAPTLPVLRDDGDGTLADVYGLSGTPYWVALHGGHVQERVDGQLSVEDFDRLVNLAQDGDDAP